MEINHNDPNNSHDADGFNGNNSSGSNNGPGGNNSPDSGNNHGSSHATDNGNNYYINNGPGSGNNYGLNNEPGNSNNYYIDNSPGNGNNFGSNNNHYGNGNNHYQNNNYTSQPGNYAYPPPSRRPGGSFSIAAMILGILAIVSTMVLPIYLPFILGSLAVLFALLSKGSANKLSGKALTGVTCGTVGIGLNVALLAASLLLLLSHPDLLIEAGRMYDEQIEQMYGVPSEDILGESVEDMIKDMFPSSTW